MTSGGARAAPAVLFVDDDGWASFDQTAVSLKRRGVRAVRVVTREPARFRRMLSEPRLRWSADRLFYDEVLDVGSEAGRARLLQLDGEGVIADAMIAEPTLLRIGLETDLGRLIVGRSLAFRGAPPAVLLDKFEVNAQLAEAGVPVPVQIPVDQCSPAEAVARFGLPIILKIPTGASGYGVRIVRAFPELGAAIAELAEGGQRPFYQEHVQGPVVMYTAVLGPGGQPRLEHGFKVERAQSELGASAAVSLYDRPELIALGRRAAALFRPEGFAAFGFVEAPDGQLLHIDANIRVWGNIASPLKLGIDFLEAYAALVRGDPWRVPASPAATSPALRVYPYALYEAVRSGGPRDIAASARDFLKVCSGPLGWRYCLQSLGEAALLGVRRLVRRKPPAVRRKAERLARQNP